MAAESELTGIGVPSQLAHILGGEPTALTTTGTAQTTAATIKSKNTELTTAGSQTGAILPSSYLYAFFAVVNPTATTGVVYCPVGDTMNGSSNGSVSVAQNKAAIFWQYKKGAWASILTA